MPSLDISDLAILLIEPSMVQAKIITQHLNDAGVHMLEVAGSGKEGLEILQSNSPDLVISSLYLPDMSAIDLLQEIKKAGATADIPFMLISSESRFAELDAIRQAGVVAILPKPFDHADLQRALRATIEFIEPEEMELDHYDIDTIRVLVVDDSNLARKHICKVLNNVGIQNIELAENGRQAVDIFTHADQSFDLIVTDYNMPEMDGQELVRFIRNELHNSFVPILMVTSEQNKARLSNVQRSGVSAICDKPFEPQTVKEMLCRVLDG